MRFWDQKDKELKHPVGTQISLKTPKSSGGNSELRVARGKPLAAARPAHAL